MAWGWGGEGGGGSPPPLPATWTVLTIDWHSSHMQWWKCMECNAKYSNVALIQVTYQGINQTETILTGKQ